MARPKVSHYEQDERQRIGATLRALRGPRPIDEVANLILTTRPFLSNVEAGRKRLTPAMAEKLAEVYGVPLLAIVHPTYYAERSPHGTVQTFLAHRIAREELCELCEAFQRGFASSQQLAAGDAA